jgi:hypothetical protein
MLFPPVFAIAKEILTGMSYRQWQVRQQLSNLPGLLRFLLSVIRVTLLRLLTESELIQDIDSMK